MTKLYIGIDPGTHTGVAVWDADARKLVDVATMPIHRALAYVEQLALTEEVKQLVFEDARQRTWFGHYDKRLRRWVEDGRATLAGAGSIKRDSSIWEDFCRDKGISFWAHAPVKGGTKMDEERFKAITGWRKRTSEHARDATMLVFGR